MTRHVVFDFDGTLVDSLGSLVRAYNEIAARRGFRPMTEESIAHMRRLQPRERAAFLRVRWYHVPMLARELKQAWRDELPRLQSFPGVPDMLGELHRSGHRLSVISSNSVENIRQLAGQAGWPPLLDVRSSRLFGKHRVIEKYLRTHGIRREHFIYVGDELRDAEACRKADVRMIAVMWGADQREAFATCPPTAFADGPAALVSLIEKLNASAS